MCQLFSSTDANSWVSGDILIRKENVPDMLPTAAKTFNLTEKSERGADAMSACS